MPYNMYMKRKILNHIFRLQEEISDEVELSRASIKLRDKPSPPHLA